MYLVVIVLTVLVSILMIGIVLIQKSKGGGLSSQFGGGNQVLGVRGTNTFLEKATWSLAILILILSVFAAYTMPKADRLGATRANAADVKTAPANTQTGAFQTGAEAQQGAAQQTQAAPDLKVETTPEQALEVAAEAESVAPVTAPTEAD